MAELLEGLQWADNGRSYFLQLLSVLATGDHIYLEFAQVIKKRDNPTMYIERKLKEGGY